MDVTEKEAFKLGFLYRCAEEGVAGEELQARVKTAAEVVKQGFIDLSKWNNALANMGNLAYLPLAGATIAGGLGGHALAKLTEPDVDEDDLKAKELAAAYKAYAARAKTNRKLRLYRQGG